jgi:ribosomal protein S6
MAKKDIKAAEAVEEALDTDHAEHRVYELGFHLDPELTESDAKKAYQALRDLAASKGSIVAEGEPQKVQLAYTVSRTEQSVRRDFDSSFFSWFAYEVDGAGHDAVVEAAKAENRIFRFIDLRTTKEAAQHSAEMHEIMLKAAQDKRDMVEEEVSDTELDAALKEVA